MKRKESPAGQVSPPPTKRKIESTVTGKAIANFFTPISKKEPDRLTWRVIHDSVLVGRYQVPETHAPVKQRKIAAFDFDSTLIQTSSGNVFGKDATDWKWWDPSVPPKLRALHADGFDIAIISNQGGINLKHDPKTVKSDQKRLAVFKEKVGHVLNQLDFPVCIMAATSNDQFRKPRNGMWKELMEELDYDEGSGADLSNSIFVGDAAGRLPSKSHKADHSSSDRDFASNVGIAFSTPEEYFRGEQPLEWKRRFDPVAFTEEQLNIEKIEQEIPHSTEIVLLCGSPGSGKSTLYFNVLKALGYERVNQDILKTREKCFSAATELLAAHRSVVVDSTNADRDTRARWIKLAREAEVKIRCILLETPLEICRHNDTVRALNDGTFNPEKRTLLPTMAFTGFASRFKEPSLDEGFEQITKIPFMFQGDEDQKKIWTRYWV